LTYGHNANTSVVGKKLLAPIKKSTRRPALSRRDHHTKMAKTGDAINSVENRLTFDDICFRYLYLN
jgi:hypothetical protein